MKDGTRWISWADQHALFLPVESKSIWDSLDEPSRRWVFRASWRGWTHDDPSIARVISDLQAMQLARTGLDVASSPRDKMIGIAVGLALAIGLGWAFGPAVGVGLLAALFVIVTPTIRWYDKVRDSFHMNRAIAARSVAPQDE